MLALRRAGALEEELAKWLPPERECRRVRWDSRSRARVTGLNIKRSWATDSISTKRQGLHGCGVVEARDRVQLDVCPIGAQTHQDRTTVLQIAIYAIPAHPSMKLNDLAACSRSTDGGRNCVQWLHGQSRSELL